MALIEGTVIKFTDGTTGIVRKKIGEGGQGEVYEIDYGGIARALKWFKKNPERKVSESIKANLTRRTSIPSYFQWPIAVCDNSLGFGYVMNLVDTQNYKELKHYIFSPNKCDFKDRRAIVNACLNLCLAFKKLHAHGLAYFDMNHGNFFFNPENGDTIIIDTDNIAPAGKIATKVQGTDGYMAPELVSFKIPDGISADQEEKYIPRPNRYTDYYSLSVVLFRIIFRDHPLEGEFLDRFPCNTPKAKKYMFGDNPVFIYDPSNSENRPIEEESPSVISRWKDFVPSYVKDAFIRAFSYENLHTPQKRLMESEWIKVFTKWRSQICQCPQCGKETHFEYKGNDSGVCENCHEKSQIYWMRIVGDDVIVPLVKGVKLFGSQIGLDNSYFKEVARIGKKKTSNSLALLNTSSLEWFAHLSTDTSARIIKPGDNIELCNQLTIQFSNLKEAKIILK